MLAQGKKLEAIKLARETTGFPLEAAKDIVDTIEKGKTMGSTTMTFIHAFRGRARTVIFRPHR